MRFKDVVIRGSALLLMGVAMAGGSARAGAVVYSNDFQTNTAGFSSSSRTTLPTTADPTAPTSRYLGRFGTGNVTLGLTGLTAGQMYAVRFDLFLGATWDGSFGNSAGPDVFRLTAGSNTLVDASFGYATSEINGVQPLRQSYSDETPVNGDPYTAAFYGRTGADVNYFSSTLRDNYSIYYFGHGAGNPILTFIANGATETLTFSGLSLQSSSDEFWAIDNVSVTAVPEPSSIALSLIGLAAAGLYGRRRARG
ncbi:PEP-CTERM sorting domain-containing protein [Paludisphaera sp.]|uniref:PEP-CTERM sorting domain-containing protein n=1 Tax=Paludisphaera sp. TaxID=2017432 RepID=UPI00301CFB65